MAGVGGARLVCLSMTAGGAAIKARGCPPICFANRFPPRPLARRGAMLRGPDSHAATRLVGDVLDEEDVERWRQIMAHVSQVAAADRVLDALIAGLEIEFGRCAGTGLAARFIAAEEADFLWDARREERWLGAYESVEDDGFELDRVAIVGRMNGRWFVAQMIVDGDGHAHGMLGRRDFRSEKAARKGFADAH